MAAGKSAILTVKILTDAKNAQKGINDAATSYDKFASGVSAATPAATVALAAVTAGAVDAAKAAADDAAAADQLALALKNTTGASDAQVASTDAWIQSLSSATAVADDELRPALATLARATGDVGTAQDALTLALDVSAATGKSVESVSNSLAKGYGGQTDALKRLVPGLDEAVVASGDMALITDELARLTGGAAATAAGSAQGQYESLKIELEELKESIGEKLIPVIGDMIDWIKKAIDFASKHKDGLIILGAAVALVSSFVLVLNAALKVYKAVQVAGTAVTKAATIAQKLWNKAMLANPIGLIIAGVAALAAGFIYLWNNCEGFKNFFLKAWDLIKGAVESLMGPINRMIDGFKTAIGWVQDLINKISNIKMPSIDFTPWENTATATVAVAGSSPTVGARAAGATSSSSGGVTINVNGALDPVAVANQIRDVLRRDVRRRNGVTIGVVR